MFIRIFHSSIEFIPCESKLRYSGVGVGLIFDLSTIDSASCNSFMFKIIGADIENVLVRPTPVFSFLQHVFVFIKEAPIDRVVHQCCGQKCLLHVELLFQNG